MFQNNPSNYYAFLPMILACDDKYQNLSARGCYLYSLMLSRMNLSERNRDRFSDENGVFIYFSIEEIGRYLNCSKPTAIGTVQELISAELVKRGECPNGKSPKYYVKKLDKQPKMFEEQEQIRQREVSFDVESNLTQKQKNRRNFGDAKVCKEAEKEVSFDVEKAKETELKHLYNFAEKPKKRRTRNPGPTLW